MKMNPYLNFNGQCKAAFTFYQQCFGGEITMMLTHGESPMAEQTPAGWKDAIMHARLEFDGNALMGSDAPGDYFKPPQGFFVNLAINEVAKAEQVFNALAQGGKVEMPIQQTFWAARFGMLIDQFGIPWMINCETTA